MRKLLGLDPSKHCGWASGSPGDKPRCGTWQLPDYGGHDGRTFWAIVQWLTTFIKSEGITDVFWEGVWIPDLRQKNARVRALNHNTTHKLVSFANAIQAACVNPYAGINIEDRYVTASEWRVNFFGHAKGGTDHLKDEAMTECFKRGWLISNHHEAEAAGVWFFGCLCVDKSLRWEHQESPGKLRGKKDAAVHSSILQPQEKM